MSVIEREIRHHTTHVDFLKVIVQDMLREHLADPSVRITDLETEPISGGGFSGNEVVRIRVTWVGAYASGGPGSGTWVLKRWLPGGPGRRLLGVDRPLEALGWDRGFLRPESLPSGVLVPIVGARLDPAGETAWILMEDVSGALGQYSRDLCLPPSVAVERARLVLDRLARLHVWWEHPVRQAELSACRWLVSTERFLWCEAASYAAMLGRDVPPGVAPGSAVTDELRADVAALLDWIPSGDRPVFEALMCKRGPLVEALRDAPRTLLHGDLDDRNLGLRQIWPPPSDEEDASSSPELVLIDWEWIGYGTPALDVARIWVTIAAICDPSQPCPDAAFSDELPAYYFERYRAYGGALLDPRSWSRACALAVIAYAMSQVSFIGSMLRHDVRPVVATMERQIDTMIGTARSLFAA